MLLKEISFRVDDVAEAFIPTGLFNQPFLENRKRRGKIDIPFFVLTLIILTIGLITLFSASHAYAYYNKGNSFFYIQKQALFAVIGVVAMIAISQVNHRFIERWSTLLFAGSIVLLVVVLFMRDSNGFARWFYIGGMSFQPSEIAKFALIVLFAHMASVYGEKMNKAHFGLWPFVIILGLVCVLVIAERHLSGTIIVGLLGVAMMWYGGTNIKYFMIAIIGVVAAAAIILIIPSFMAYTGDRITTWLDPYSDAKGSGYQTIQSLIAIGSGGLFGTGIGNSRQKYLYIPEPQNDFIFAVGCEELGFVGASMILILFALLIWRGFVISRTCSDTFGKLLAAGCTTHVGMQVILNIAVVTNTIPNTGITLPFFSNGGTALLMTLGEMGIILSVSKHSKISNPNRESEEV